MDTTIKDLFEGLGLVIDEDCLEASDNNDGIVSNIAVQQANKKLSPIKSDFGVSHIVIYPFWMNLNFHPYTLAKLARGKTFPSYNVGLTPAELINVLKQASTMSEEDEASENADALRLTKGEYRAKLYKLLGIKDINTELEIDPETGECSQEVFEIFTPYLNNYNVQAATQRYHLSADKVVTRAASLKINANGTIDTLSSDPVLLNAFACETALLQAEIQKYTAEAEAKEEPKKTIETQVSSIRQGRAVSSPYIVSVASCFAIPSSSSSIIGADDITRLSSDTFDFKYLMCYDKMNADLLKKLQDIKARNVFTNVNYLPVQRTIPLESDKVPNLGVAIQTCEYATVSTKKPITAQLDNFNRRISEAMKENEFLDPDRFKSSVAKFGPISIDEVIRCYTNNIGQYKRALADPSIVNANQKYLSEISESLSATYVRSQNVIDVEVTELIKNTPADEPDVLDSEDTVDMGVASSASAKDFV